VLAGCGEIKPVYWIQPDMRFKIGRVELEIVRGDITTQGTEAIVNAANSSLMGGGGVDGAIHRAGGPKIKDECAKIRNESWPDGLPAGKAVITSGGNLKADFVIHTVGPVWRGGNSGEGRVLENCYRNCLELADGEGIGSMSFPSISTGAYGYPVCEAGRIAVRTVIECVSSKETHLEKIRFVLYSEPDLKTYEAISEKELGRRL